MADTIHCKNTLGEEVDIPREKFFFRPSVYGLIINEGKVVVMRNKSNDKLWFPGGGVEIGEYLEDALHREISEEAGLKVEVKELLLFKENFFYYQPLDEAYHGFLYFYRCKPITIELIADSLVSDYESEKPRWMNIADIKKDDFSDLSEEIYSCLQQLLNTTNAS